MREAVTEAMPEYPKLLWRSEILTNVSRKKNTQQKHTRKDEK